MKRYLVPKQEEMPCPTAKYLFPQWPLGQEWFVSSTPTIMTDGKIVATGRILLMFSAVCMIRVTGDIVRVETPKIQQNV